ncbi:creatininase family protein [Pseudoroseomonas globiformis]|uniref:Creatininase family protein n=1 Tax=Teichococcus globiformis TaxID=2307229 RepID=A0ABV7G2T1_9PROT
MTLASLDLPEDAVRWDRLTAPELRDLAERGAVVVLPVAALEQHGPHLPVWTDSMIGHACCLRAARKAGVPAVVLPPMWTGMSEHHLPFGGTISLDYATFRAVLACVCRSVKAQGFGRLFLVNSHGGNIDPLAVAARELCIEFGMPVVATTIFHVSGEKLPAILERQPGVMHACEAETSYWLALHPEQVRQDEVEGALSDPATSVPGPFSRFWSFAERAPRTGVMGDPRAATADKGEALLEAVSDALAQAMRNEALWQAPRKVW